MMDEITVEKLTQDIIDIRDSGGDPSTQLRLLQGMVPYPNVRELFITDQGAAYIARRALAYGVEPPGPGQFQALVELVRKIRMFEGSECDVDIAEDRLRASLSHSRLRSLLADTALSDKEVVQAGQSYAAVAMPAGGTEPPGDVLDD